MKTITIPETMKPSFYCTINGKKYSYPAGETVEVPDEVAAVIQNCINATTTPIEGEPALTQPAWGMRTVQVKKTKVAGGLGRMYVNSFGQFEMSKEEYEAMISSEEFKGTIYRGHVEFHDDGDVTTTYSEYPLNKDDLLYNEEYGYAYVKDFEDQSGYEEDYWKVTYGTHYVTETIYEQIPQEYLATE